MLEGIRTAALLRGMAMAIACSGQARATSFPPTRDEPPDIMEWLAANPRVADTLIAIFIAMFLLLVIATLRNIRLLRQRKQTIEAQRAMLEFQQTALDQHAVVNIVDGDGHIEYVNENFLQQLGYTREEIIGQQSRTLWADHLEPERFRQLAETVRSGKPWSGELPTLTKSGEVIWSQATIVPMMAPDGTLLRTASIRTNITASRRAQEDRTMRFSLDILGDPVCKFRPDTLEFTYINAAGLKMLGWPEGGWVGRGVADLIPGFEEQRFRRRIEQLLASETGRIDFEMRGPRRVYFHVTLQLFQPEGREPRVIGIMRDITEKVAQRHRLAALNAALDLADHEVYILRPDTLEYTYLNAAARTRTGWSEEEYLGKRPYDDDPDFDEDRFRKRVLPLTQGESSVITFERDRLHNRPTEVSIQLLNLPDEGQRFVIVVRDIAERRAKEREIRRFKLALDHSADAVHMFWPDSLRMFYGNEVARQRLGVSMETFTTLTPMDTNPKLDEAVLRARLQTLIDGPERSLVYESVSRLQDGSLLPVEVNLQYIAPEGSRPYFMAILRDLSAAKIAEKAKSEFVATVSHELRTPLTSIKGSLGLVRAGALGELSEKQASMIEIAYKNCDRLTLLINDILDIEKIEAGKMDFNIETIDISSVVAEGLRSIEGYAREHKATVRLETPEVAAPIDADADRLMQVLHNLLSNAIKFSDPGGEVRIAVERLASRVRVTISDDGTGIPEQAQPTIFDKFTQADSSDVRRKGGTGLGLSIAKLIVERMGGTIDFASVPGEGTDFWFELPISGASDQPEKDSTGETLLLFGSECALSDTALAGAPAATVRATSARVARRLLRQTGARLVVMAPECVAKGLYAAAIPTEHAKVLPAIVASPSDRSAARDTCQMLLASVSGEVPAVLRICGEPQPSGARLPGVEAEVTTVSDIEAATDLLRTQRFDLLWIESPVTLEELCTLRDAARVCKLAVAWHVDDSDHLAAETGPLRPQIGYSGENRPDAVPVPREVALRKMHASLKRKWNFDTKAQ